MSTLLIVIPCLNEEEHLAGLLATLCADPGAAGARIVVADGGSRDRSVAIAQAVAAKDARVHVLNNPKRIQAAAINLAVNTFGDGAEYLVRVDAHARYPHDYIAQLLAARAASGADSVVVSMRAQATTKSCFQIANAAAQNSKLGAGGSAHREAGARRFIDHGHHALFRMEAFRAAGLYDESFSHNEDAEFDARLTAQGGKILLAGDIVIGYVPRARALALARQYYSFGRGRARMLLRHQARPKLRQLAPVMVGPCLIMAGLAPAAGALGWLLAAPATAWLIACALGGAFLGLKNRSWCAAFAGAPAAIIHLSWSLGFWRQMLTGETPS